MRDFQMVFQASFIATFTILILVPATCANGRLYVQDDASWKDRFLEEAPPAWQKYRERAKQLQGSIKRTTINLATKREMVDRALCEIKQRNDCALFLSQDDLETANPPRQTGIVLGINDRYGFEISRTASTAPWVVANLDLDLSDGMKFTLTSPGPREIARNWSTCLIDTFFLIPRFSWNGVEDPGFTLKRVTSSTWNDARAVKVEFDYHPPSDKSRIPSVNGWIVYDPQKLWVIHEYNTQVQWGSNGLTATIVVSNEYEDTPDGFPLPRRVIRRFTPSKGVDREYHYELDLKEGKVPESDFTLSAFGLPEPPGMQRRWQPWYLWCAIAGMICLSLAVWFRWRSRRGAGSG